MQRVVDQGDLRPMAGNKQAMDDLRLILQERSPFYAKADWKGKQFIDVGCGMGRNSYWPMRYGATRGLAIDVDERSLAVARKTLAEFPTVDVRRFRMGRRANHGPAGAVGNLAWWPGARANRGYRVRCRPRHSHRAAFLGKPGPRSRRNAHPDQSA